MESDFPIDLASFHHVGDVGYLETSYSGLVPFRVVDVIVTYSEKDRAVWDAVYLIEYCPSHPDHPWLGRQGRFSLKEPGRYVWGLLPDLFQFLEVAGTDEGSHIEDTFRVIAEIDTLVPFSLAVFADAFAVIERNSVRVTRVLVNSKDVDPNDWNRGADFSHVPSKLWGAQIDAAKPGVAWVVGENGTAVKINGN